MIKTLRNPSRRAGTTTTSADADRWVKLLSAQRLGAESKGRQVARTSEAEDAGMVDIRVAGPGDPKPPSEVFNRLRWGGLFACVDLDAERVARVMQSYDGKQGFVIEQGFEEVWGGPRGLRIPGVTPRAYSFIARKTHLVVPGEVSDRFTYDVTLQADAQDPARYIVRKQIPTAADLVERLKRKHPEAEPADLDARARVLVDEVFPVFLTREARVLSGLQTALPSTYRSRVPRPLRLKKNAAGMVTRLEMQWLRNGGGAISHLEFARQSAELLSVLHDEAGIMHLDLRPDNMVVTPDGVGFIDFGSAAGVAEDLSKNPVLRQLFTQMTRTSQVHRVLNQMMEKGQITNDAIRAVKGRADRGVDTFYLAVQINRPHTNPELERLIDYHPMGEVAKSLEALTAAVLRPKNPDAGAFKTAADLVRGITRIQRKLGE
ncbi:MAG: phosphotransferase [Planctomycetota bacterium]